MQAKTEWKPIEGFENYLVSNDGQIINTKRNRKLKTQLSKQGYIRVRLGKDGKMHNFQVHRLVAKAFIPNPDNLPQVNHIDEDKTNNSVSNLEWCTSAYNLTYGTRMERIAYSNSHNGRKKVKIKRPKEEINKQISETLRKKFASGELVNKWTPEQIAKRVERRRINAS